MTALAEDIMSKALGSILLHLEVEMVAGPPLVTNRYESSPVCMDWMITDIWHTGFSLRRTSCLSVSVGTLEFWFEMPSCPDVLGLEHFTSLFVLIIPDLGSLQ